MTDFVTTTMTIWKNTYEIVCGTCSCSIYRLSDKAAIGRVAKEMFYFKNEDEKNAGILDFYNREKDYLERKEQRRQERLQYNKENKRKTPAQYIKEALQKKFPWVKFSCRYKTFSMGNDVTVSWKGWPLKAEVEPIVNSYEYWYFDGMTDMYEIYEKRSHPDEQLAKYTWCEREYDVEETKKWISDLGYTAEWLLEDVKDIYEYDKTGCIARRISWKLDELSENKWENWSQEVSRRNEEIWHICARYIINDIYYSKKHNEENN